MASRLLMVGLAVLAMVLGSCLVIEAHQPEAGGQSEPCDVTTVGVKAGVERVPSLERGAPVLTPSMADVTIVWHCGTPDEPPPVIAEAASSVRPSAQRAPPRG